jgi:hypothetical protein
MIVSKGAVKPMLDSVVLPRIECASQNVILRRQSFTSSRAKIDLESDICTPAPDNDCCPERR